MSLHFSEHMSSRYARDDRFLGIVSKSTSLPDAYADACMFTYVFDVWLQDQDMTIDGNTIAPWFWKFSERTQSITTTLHFAKINPRDEVAQKWFTNPQAPDYPISAKINCYPSGKIIAIGPEPNPAAFTLDTLHWICFDIHDREKETFSASYGEGFDKTLNIAHVDSIPAIIEKYLDWFKKTGERRFMKSDKTIVSIAQSMAKLSQHTKSYV